MIVYHDPLISPLAHSLPRACWMGPVAIIVTVWYELLSRVLHQKFPGSHSFLTDGPDDTGLMRTALDTRRLVALSSSLPDCLGRVRRVKAKPHAVASRALTRRTRPEGWQLSRRTGKSRARPSTRAGPRFARAIGGPLTAVTSGLSRSLADTPPRRSRHVTGPHGTASQAEIGVLGIREQFWGISADYGARLSVSSRLDQRGQGFARAIRSLGHWRISAGSNCAQFLSMRSCSCE